MEHYVVQVEVLSEVCDSQRVLVRGEELREEEPLAVPRLADCTQRSECRCVASVDAILRSHLECTHNREGAPDRELKHYLSRVSSLLLSEVCSEGHLPPSKASVAVDCEMFVKDDVPP